MSLTFGSGPFSKSPRRGAVNFPLDDVAPPHQMFWQPDERRLRAVIEDIVVLDTTRARLLHETAVVPRVYAPLEDFRRDLLVWSRTTTHCPWKGDASHLSLRGEGGVVEDLVPGSRTSPGATSSRSPTRSASRATSASTSPTRRCASRSRPRDGGQSAKWVLGRGCGSPSTITSTFSLRKATMPAIGSSCRDG